MVRYKGRRVSRSIGILAANKKGRFIIHDYSHWKSQSPFPHEESFDWILSKNFITPHAVFVGPNFGKSGLLENPLSNPDTLYAALITLNRNGSSKNAGISASVPAYRPTDYHEYWIEKIESGHGKPVYHIFYNQTDKVPFEVLSADEFHFDYVFCYPYSTINV